MLPWVSAWMNDRIIQSVTQWCCSCFCCRWVAPAVIKVVDDVEDFERRCDTTSSAWQDSEGYSGEPVECELARSGRQRNKVSQHSDTDRHMHCRSANGRYDHQHHDHQHHLRADWNWTDRTTHDDRQQCVDYEQQLQKHGWRMEVHGDPLNIKCVLCVVHGLSSPAVAYCPFSWLHSSSSSSSSSSSYFRLFCSCRTQLIT